MCRKMSIKNLWFFVKKLVFLTYCGKMVTKMSLLRQNGHKNKLTTIKWSQKQTYYDKMVTKTNLLR